MSMPIRKFSDTNDLLFMMALILSNNDDYKKSIKSDEEPQVISEPIKKSMLRRNKPYLSPIKNLTRCKKRRSQSIEVKLKF